MSFRVYDCLWPFCSSLRTASLRRCVQEQSTLHTPMIKAKMTQSILVYIQSYRLPNVPTEVHASHAPNNHREYHCLKNAYI